MVKKLFVLIFFAFVSHASGGEMIASPEHDIGKFPASKGITHVFTIENKGSGTLSLGNVEHGWGIAYTFLSGREIPEGGKGDIEIRLAPCAPGKFEKVIIIRINKPPGILNIRIRGEAVEETKPANR